VGDGGIGEVEGPIARDNRSEVGNRGIVSSHVFPRERRHEVSNEQGCVVRTWSPAVLDPYEERWVARDAVDEESLGGGGFGVFGVIVGVGFGRFDGVMRGMVKMPDGDLRMMRGTVMIPDS
jgi:hypothetical protein